MTDQAPEGQDTGSGPTADTQDTTAPAPGATAGTPEADGTSGATDGTPTADGTAGAPEAAAPASGPDPAPARGLTEREAEVLAYEARAWPGPGAKERAIREDLRMSPVRYYQLLNALIDDPRALRHAPGTVHRLQRIRTERRARR
ncbi:DUF3263 domain-containing protein [Streptomyces sp. NPDC097619]|uniref:DUF3263 domain-containing protein n=1 Tax=Streptomyces sp. NPDC097619 TaxID=3157228 RepID=UPI003324FA12